MIKYEIVGQEPKPKNIVRLRLRMNDDGVDLCAGPVGGGEYYILSLKPNGTISRLAHVGETLGFPLDEKGRVVID